MPTFNHPTVPVKQGFGNNPQISGPIETVRIGMVSDGNPVKLADIQDEMRAEERDGWYRILRMDDTEAVIQWLDPRIALILGPEGSVA
jgi:hypothetical protein